MIMPCKCSHYNFFHGHIYESPPGQHSYFCVGNCPCQVYQEMENLEYVEWKADKSFIKSIPDILCWPFKWYYRSWCEKSTFQLIFKTLVSFGLVYLVYCFPHVIHDMLEDGRKRVEAVKTMQVECYSGNLLLYSGHVTSYPDTMSGGVTKIRTEKGEYTCNGFHQSN